MTTSSSGSDEWPARHSGIAPSREEIISVASERASALVKPAREGSPKSVRAAMLRHPRVHPVALTVGQARAAFAASAHNHMLLLVQDGTLVSTVIRADLDPAAGDTTPATALGSLDGRTISPDAELAPAHDAMLSQQIRRLAVVGRHGRLLGLLCLKSSHSGFCTDHGVAQMRLARQQPAGGATP